jgi:glycerol-3-phosphate dehydrogenase
VLGPEFVCSDHALLIPRTDDGRVIFAIPWSGHLLVGTTDIPVAEPNREPRPTRQEVDYLLRYVGAYLDPPPCLSDVRSVWAGIRPLVAGKPGAATSRLSREHAIFEAIPGLVSVVGGKWTTYRSMAEAVVDRASISGSLPRRASGTRSLPIEDPGDSGVGVAGESFVRRAVREEMARTAEDLLARRSRILFLDARRARALAEPVAGLMAAELGRNEEWVEAQVRQMVRLSEDYLPFGFEDGGSDA